MNEITLESIAKHCIDDNITSDQEVTNCIRCGRRVCNLCSIDGLCRDCLRVELARLRGIEEAQ